jgi:CRP-like cAMP-binding protein
MIHPEMLLKQVPLFRSLPLDECRRMASLLKKHYLKKGDVLFRKGDEGTALYMILAGKLKISRQSRDGDEVILAVLGGGDFCGEMAILDGFPRSADAVALEETQLFGLNRKDFLTYMMNHETAVQAILAALTQRLRKADDFLEDIFFLNVSARLAKKLIELALADGYQEGQSEPGAVSATQKELAGMIGTSRESVNKELRILREKDLVSISGNRILITDMEALRRRIR